MRSPSPLRRLARLAAWAARRGPPADPLQGLAPAAARLVVGLGNPGPRYAATRHNVGFMVVDRLAADLDAPWVPVTRHGGTLLAHATVQSCHLLLAKPQTFMNLSGTAVGSLLDDARLGPEQVLVVYDDMDLPFGRLRLRDRGSAGTHNGMRNVVQVLSTDRFARLRVGIGQSSSADAQAHVLSLFDEHERAQVPRVVERAVAAVRDWATLGAAAAMNRHNR